MLKDADWFFHYHPWQYNNADSTWRFIRSTGAKTATLAVEDGPFGSSAMSNQEPSPGTMASPLRRPRPLRPARRT